MWRSCLVLKCVIVVNAVSAVAVAATILVVIIKFKIMVSLLHRHTYKHIHTFVVDVRQEDTIGNVLALLERVL